MLTGKLVIYTNEDDDIPEDTFTGNRNKILTVGALQAQGTSVVCPSNETEFTWAWFPCNGDICKGNITLIMCVFEVDHNIYKDRRACMTIWQIGQVHKHART